MVITDMKKEANKLFIEEGVTKVSLAEKMGVPQQYISKYLDHCDIPKKFVEMVEALGYDIEVKYVKRSEES